MEVVGPHSVRPACGITRVRCLSLRLTREWRGKRDPGVAAQHQAREAFNQQLKEVTENAQKGKPQNGEVNGRLASAARKGEGGRGEGAEETVQSWGCQKRAEDGGSAHRPAQEQLAAVTLGAPGKPAECKEDPEDVMEHDKPHR